jgi:hypothetical protein
VNALCHRQQQGARCSRVRCAHERKLHRRDFSATSTGTESVQQRKSTDEMAPARSSSSRNEPPRPRACRDCQPENVAGPIRTAGRCSAFVHAPFRFRIQRCNDVRERPHSERCRVVERIQLYLRDAPPSSNLVVMGTAGRQTGREQVVHTENRVSRSCDSRYARTVRHTQLSERELRSLQQQRFQQTCVRVPWS